MSGERLSGLWRPPESVFSQQLGEGLSDGAKILDEAATVVRQFEECVHRPDRVWLWPVQHGADLLLIHGGTLR
jgi:hypothetical protein